MRPQPFFCLLLVFFPILILRAQSPIPLYEAGHVPNSIPTTVLNDSLLYNIAPGHDTLIVVPRTLMPTFRVFKPAPQKATGIAVIVCSGGSYRGVADWVEGIPAARQLAAAGITAFVLHYRVPRSDLMTNKENVPMQDLQTAIRYIREHAKDYHIDTSDVGVMGFSAGGHLVSTVCTHLDDIFIDNPLSTNLRPDFMILTYPVISFADSLTHLLSRKNLIGPDISPERIREYSNELHVNDRTPPAFITHAIDDTEVKVANSLYFAAAMEERQIPVQLYLYAKGGHGFGVENPTTTTQWIDPCIRWIKAQSWKLRPSQK
jgi:acetyl esterase/lipase